MRAMSAIRTFAVSIIALSLLLATSFMAHAQSAEVRFFPETGHSLRGDFLKFYNTARDPNLVYGYPITEQFTSRDGKTVQYFQRARFELTDSMTIALTPIGRITRQPGNALEAKNPAACQPVSGIPVCYAFLDFYKAHGGAAQFGNPLGAAEENAGVFMQYFDYARFEWQTSPSQSRIRISDLGTIFFHSEGEDRARLHPVSPQDTTINPVLSIQPRAFVAKSVTRSNDTQTVSIVVRSQTLQPLGGAEGIATIRFPDATSKEFKFTTDQFGVGQFSFDFSNIKVGELVLIEINVTYYDLPGRTITSFRVWY